MANKAIKQEIINGAIRLFNAHGLVNVRLQQIADQAGISIGNLAYHYASKQAIVGAIQEQISGVIEPVLSEKKTFPTLIDFDNQLSVYFSLVQSHAFYFSDLLEIERAYPQIHARSMDHLSQMIHQIEKWLALNQKNGSIKPEASPGQYQQLSMTIWMTIQFWKVQAIIRGEEGKNEGKFKSTIWSVVRPYFTETGQAEYEMIILPQLINFMN